MEGSLWLDYRILRNINLNTIGDIDGNILSRLEYCSF